MIQLLEAETATWRTLCGRDAFGTRLAASQQAHGTLPDADFWVQTGNGLPTAAIGCVTGELTLYAAPQADMAELRAFVQTVPHRGLLCEQACCAALHLVPAQTGLMLQFAGGEKPVQANPQPLYTDALRAVYALLVAAEFSGLGSEEHWLADICLRIRGGQAAVFGYTQNNTLLATASVLFQTADAAFMGAVAVQKKARGAGVGGALVSAVAQACAQQNQRVNLFCKEELLPFYAKNGFVPCGRWAYTKKQ